VSNLVARAAATGVVATLVMDVGASLFRALHVTRGVEIAWVGRWFNLVFHGHPVVGDIRADPTAPLPLPVGLLLHYAIGVTLALAYHAAVRNPGAASAIGFGLLTNVLPWLLMFPAMGFGLFGARGPAENLLFRSSLINHLCWGVGLAIAVKCYSRLWPVELPSS
jgi:hypothetical protein